MTSIGAQSRRGPVRIEHTAAPVVVRVCAAWEVSAAALPAALRAGGSGDLRLILDAEIEPASRTPRSNGSAKAASGWTWRGTARLTPLNGVSHSREQQLVRESEGHGTIGTSDGFAHADLPGFLSVSAEAREGPGRLIWAATPLLVELGIPGGCSQLVEASVTIVPGA
jgi:hypothetical protein